MSRKQAPAGVAPAEWTQAKRTEECCICGLEFADPRLSTIIQGPYNLTRKSYPYNELSAAHHRICVRCQAIQEWLTHMGAAAPTEESQNPWLQTLLSLNILRKSVRGTVVPTWKRKYAKKKDVFEV